jgi:hypothetical protein
MEVVWFTSLGKTAQRHSLDRRLDGPQTLWREGEREREREKLLSLPEIEYQFLGLSCMTELSRLLSLVTNCYTKAVHLARVGDAC